MNLKMIGRFLAMILFGEAVFLCFPIPLSLLDGTHGVTVAFLLSVLIALLPASLLIAWSRRAPRAFFAKEGFVSVAAGWILLSLVGALPFVFSGAIPNYVDALFETVSGFTTTGASIMTDVENVPRAILLWRSFTHWVGGMGVLVFLLAIIPAGGKNAGFTLHLFRAESPGPEVGKLVPKLRQTASFLYVTYLLLTLLNIFFLLIGDMDVFEAICTALGTAGTGGFGIKNDSMGSYSPYLQNVTTVFMLIFSVNFSCYYLLFLRQFRAVIRDEEFRLFLGIVAVATLLIAWNISGLYDTFGETVRHAAFQVASIISTSGYSSTDFDLWPSFSKGILLLLMISGACAGSTCGGMKCARVLLLFKSLRRGLSRLLHPQKVEVVRVNGQTVEERTISNTTTYLVAYMAILLASFLLVSIDNFSITTNVSAVLTCFNNVGPGLDAVGPMMNFSLYSSFSKLVLILDMLAGRLEIFPLLMLFSPGVWKRV